MDRPEALGVPEWETAGSFKSLVEQCIERQGEIYAGAAKLADFIFEELEARAAIIGTRAFKESEEHALEWLSACHDLLLAFI